MLLAMVLDSKKYKALVIVFWTLDAFTLRHVTVNTAAVDLV